MKKAVILHGTDATPEANWFPWLKAELEKCGYEVWVPQLPNSHTPNRKTYNDFLFNSGWDFTDNLVFGHSSGGVSVLNLLEDERCPRVETAVVVSAWHDSEKATLRYADLSAELFKDLFPPKGFNFELIKQKAGHIIFFHGDNDPYCPLEQARWLAEQAGSEIVVIPNGEHLGSKFPQSPQLTEALEARGWL